MIVSLFSHVVALIYPHKIFLKLNPHGRSRDMEKIKLHFILCKVKITNSDQSHNSYKQYKIDSWANTDPWTHQRWDQVPRRRGLHFLWTDINDWTGLQYRCGVWHQQLKMLVVGSQTRLNITQASQIPVFDPISVYKSYGKVLYRGVGVLRCMFSGYPAPDIEWVSPNKQVIKNSAKYEISDYGRILKIKDATLSDEGIYLCEGKGETKSNTQSVFLNVTSSPILDTYSEHPQMSDALVLEGKEAKFYCEAVSLPQENDPSPPTWKKNGRYLYKDGKKYILSDNNRVLTVTNLRRGQDSGVYQCMSENSEGVLLKEALLKVLGGRACYPMHCFIDLGLNISGNSMPNLTCNVLLQIKTCVNQLITACEGNAVNLHPTLVQSLESGAKACSQGGSQGCDFQACDIDFTFPMGVPSKTEYESGCAAMNNSIACLNAKCPGDKMVEGLGMGYNEFCRDSSIKTGLATYKECLSNASVNQDCQKYLSPDMQGGEEENEEEECRRISMYSTCAKKAVSKCGSEEAASFASETARKVITLKSKREGGIMCSTSGASSAMPAPRTLLSAALVTLAAIL
ncbi:uncharacterized protein LOC125674199 isoform X2 [Ostrea edulis]|uniref:uncharacterized protein LOC125674199 isoform X2 n=1 Tax=Ostrea edulis TaxID=37623 RepID=UPI0024AF19E1|nr:uncharacterized protein LOC125674199 isoform X2 [Ostrea edulis]